MLFLCNDIGTVQPTLVKFEYAITDDKMVVKIEIDDLHFCHSGVISS